MSEQFHPQVLPFFPNYDYNNNPVGADRSYKSPRNAVGHQQRAFNVYWATKMCSPLDLGIEVGSSRGMTPNCIHVDLYGDGKTHPFYGGGPYHSDVVQDGSRLSPIFPANTFPLILSNHSLEHLPGLKHEHQHFMPVSPDDYIIQTLCDWMMRLRSGGILAMIVPDNDYFDVLASDKDHKHAWGHGDFRKRVLDKVLDWSKAELVEYDTLKNDFSFNVVVRKP